MRERHLLTAGLAFLFQRAQNRCENGGKFTFQEASSFLEGERRSETFETLYC